MNLRHWAVALLVTAVSLPAVADAQEKKNDAVVPMPRPQAGWQQRHKAMNGRVAKGNVDLVLIGDSITHGWEGKGKKVWEKYYGKRNAVNLGIGGDRTQHVLWRLQHGNLEGIEPKLAVLMIGTNNAGTNTPEETAAGIKAIVKTLRENTPKTKILILGIFPRGATPDDARRQVNEKTNKLIQKLADDKMVYYLDIGKNFLQDDGTLSKDIMPDLLHLSERGYNIWAESIEPTVVRLMGEEGKK